MGFISDDIASRRARDSKCQSVRAGLGPGRAWQPRTVKAGGGAAVPWTGPVHKLPLSDLDLQLNASSNGPSQPP